jgi:hypothetical protein
MWVAHASEGRTMDACTLSVRGRELRRVRRAGLCTHIDARGLAQTGGARGVMQAGRDVRGHA